MKKLLSLLLLLPLLAALSADAAPTQIAQVPLLNITGTGTVKPNLMLLFDNSGSMDQTYTPDYVNDSLCRSNATLAQDAPTYQGQPELHYVVTARIFGPRGGNVMTQAVVMMGPF